MKRLQARTGAGLPLGWQELRLLAAEPSEYKVVPSRSEGASRGAAIGPRRARFLATCTGKSVAYQLPGPSSDQGVINRTGWFKPV